MDQNIKVNLVNQNYQNGNIGVALSGGGSRAMTAAMGQLRALRYLKANDGEALFDKTGYLSTVSGGSWLGGTFTYLSKDFNDDDFLGRIVTDQSKLTFGCENMLYDLNYLHDDNIGSRITSDFNIISMAYELLAMKIKGIEESIYWQNIVGDRILNHYNLYNKNDKYEPTSTFTLDESSYLKLKDENPEIEKYKVHYTKTKRPYLICNSSMFCKVEGDSFQYLIPFQTTPLYTGIKGEYSNIGVKTQEKTPIGGGFINSFAFNNVCLFKEESNYEFDYKKPYSLVDAIGTSSAFYAQLLQEKCQEWNDDIYSFYRDLHYLGKSETERIFKKHNMTKLEMEPYLFYLESDIKSFFDLTRSSLESVISRNKKTSIRKKINVNGNFNLIPEYLYWSVHSNKTVTNQYADGGNLENTGINALLSYDNINKILAFVNSGESIKQNGKGIIINGVEIEETNIILDNQIPPLFGFQPYDKGYIPYSEVEKSKDEIYRYNKVFKEMDFIDFLKKLKTNAGENFTEGTSYVTASYEVLDNEWFDIIGNRTVEFMIVYLNLVDNWFDNLDKSVKKYITRNNSWAIGDDFPHFSTFDTQLSKPEVNLLAHLTSWHIINDDNKEKFINFFTKEDSCN